MKRSVTLAGFDTPLDLSGFINQFNLQRVRHWARRTDSGITLPTSIGSGTLLSFRSGFSATMTEEEEENEEYADMDYSLVIHHKVPGSLIKIN